jgi:hypothetical protein
LGNAAFGNGLEIRIGHASHSYSNFSFAIQMQAKIQHTKSLEPPFVAACL